MVMLAIVGVTIMFVGYANNQEGNCYQIFNTLRNSTVESRDVTWLRHMYYPQLDADVTGMDPLIVIEADYQRDEVAEQRVEIGEVRKGDNESVRLEVSTPHSNNLYSRWSCKINQISRPTFLSVFCRFFFVPIDRI